ncbi:restriction endonuclease subunit S [Bradyrhizobium diazoefficiens]|uniref:restriction endonuclease subunit S n=1 Tax=Bradyrhizobium diazoefficiens TaxID=1355477 RepID=UPI001B6A4552|nr:type I restriction enzyme S subunit [Bradyrhizobium japonicum]
MDTAKQVARNSDADGPWELPNSWAWAEARSFADIVGGGTPADAADPLNFDVDGLPWITPADLSKYSRSTIAKGARSLSTTGFQRSSAQILPAGSVLISSRAPVGYCVVAEVPVCTNQGFKSLRLRNRIDPFFLRYFVVFARHLLNEAASGTTFKELSGRAMEQVLFPLAPLAEQRRIVVRLDALFAEIAEGEVALAEARKGLEVFRRALLKAAATGELTRDWRAKNSIIETGQDVLDKLPPIDRQGKKRVRATLTTRADSPAMSKLPNGWQWTTLGEIAESVRNGTSVAPRAASNQHQILRISAVRPLRIDETQIRFLDDEQAASAAEATVQAGDLLFTRYNGSADLVGVGAIYRGPKRFYPDKIIRVRLRSALAMLGEFVELAVNTSASRKHIAANIKTTAGQQGLSGESLKNTPIPIPPPSEAVEIIRRVSEALAAYADTLALLDAETSDAPRLKQSILKAAFEGRLVAQDPTDEPASGFLTRLADTPVSQRKALGRPKRRAVAAS